MRSSPISISWFLCLALLLTGCCGQAATAKPTETMPIIQVVNSPPSVLTDTPAPSPTRTRVPTYTAAPTKKPPTKTPTRAVTKTYQPIQTATPDVEQPWGEIAYFAEKKDSVYYTINLKDIDSGAISMLYESFHDKQPDAKQGLSWTPDGKKIAFGTEDSMYLTGSDIFLLTVGAEDAVNLTKTDDYDEIEPAISPKGKLIAFISNQRKGVDHPKDIYTMNLDGSHVKLLLECPQKCHNPTWSPDGKQLVFQMGDDLYVLPVGGGKPNKLVSGGINQFPSWSPDGQWIAFVRSQSLDYDYQSYLYLVRPDGSGMYALTDEFIKPRFLSWSPDGRFIVFQNGEYTSAIIHIESETILTFLIGNAIGPAWRPYDLSKLPTPTPTTVSDLFDCTNGWTQLKAGEQAKVAGDPGDAPNRVRAEPNLNATQVGLLDPGTVVTLLRGPICADGLVWWKVSHDSLSSGVGYTAEGDGKEYWLEPYE